MKAQAQARKSSSHKQQALKLVPGLKLKGGWARKAASRKAARPQQGAAAWAGVGAIGSAHGVVVLVVPLVAPWGVVIWGSVSWDWK